MPDENIRQILSDLNECEMGIDELNTIVDDVKSVKKLSEIVLPDLNNIFDDDDLIDAWFDLQSRIEEEIL